MLPLNVTTTLLHLRMCMLTRSVCVYNTWVCALMLRSTARYTMCVLLLLQILAMVLFLVGKEAVLCPAFVYRRSFYQDRLRTNIEE